MRDGHVDLDDLAVRVLDDLPVTAEQQRHLDRCAECQAEHEALRDATARGRALAGEPGLVADALPARPGPAVWSGIAAELALSDADRSAPVSQTPPPGFPGEEASAQELARVRRVPLAWLSLAAAVALLAVVAASVALLVRPETTVVEIELAALVGGEPAVATLHDDADGRTLELQLPAGRAEPEAFYELWLIDADVEGMVSLGPVVRGRTSVRVPEELDLSDFPIVDVSVEPLDGDPRHSGDSRWRGTVPA